MQAVILPSRYGASWVVMRASSDIRRLSSIFGKRLAGRGALKQEVVVFGYEYPLVRSLWENSAKITLPLASIERIMDAASTSASIKNFVSIDFQKWVAGACIASTVFVTPVAAADVLSLAMLDSESTTGPVTGFLLSSQEQRARDDFSERVSEAVRWLERGQLAQARGDYFTALDCFSEVTEKAGDLALAEYARVGHAVSLYEVGDRGQAITEMEDVSISLKGYPEIHAALAAALYADKNAPIPAERQFTIATLLDPRYTDLVWVQETKHWPPSLLKSLQKFISLS